MGEVATRGRLASVTLASLLLVLLVLVSTAHPARAAGCTVAVCPTITSLSQSAGPNSGGTSVTVRGTGFVAGATVDFGSHNVPSTFVSTTTLTTTSPSIVPGFGSLFFDVKNPDGGTSQQVVTFSFYEALPAFQLGSAAAISTYGFHGNYRTDVFGRGMDGALHHTWRPDVNGAWQAWEGLGGMLSSSPTAVSWSPNRIDVFAKGTDNGLWHKWWNGTSWNGWEPLGGVLTAAPSVSSWGDGRLDVFARGSDNALYHRFYANGWGGWERLGKRIGG